MPRAKYILPLVIIGSLGSSGCGLYVPDIHGLGKGQLEEIADENDIINQVECEIHRAVDPKLHGDTVAWLSNWNAKVSMVLTADEKGSLNPGFSLTEPFQNPAKGQFFSVAGGVNASADTTRKETVGFTYSIKDLLEKPSIPGKCANEDGVLVHSDLKIGDFVQAKSNLTTIPGTISGPYTAFTYEATFVVAYGGNITPTWKLIRFTGNPSGTFLSATRTRTDYLEITFAASDPAAPPGSKQISPTGDQQHAAGLLGQAVTSALQGQ